MTSIARQASALCLALCFSGYSNAQDYVTDNLIQSNAWQGCYTLTDTATWGGVTGGPCPNVSLDGGINFSWGQYTLSQSISINQALGAAGTGVQVTGYSYSWWVKNSNINGQQPGSYDWYTHINVDLLSPSGQILESDFYPYGYWIPQWTQFSGVRNYSSPYSLASVGTLRLSVSGWDDGYWAGYYGPEYSGFDLRINYSVDPCISNPLYSPTCAGYAQAILALTPQTENTTTTPMVEITETNTGVTATPISQSTAATASTESTSERSGTGISLSSVLNILAREQSRISAIERSTVESSVEQSITQGQQATEQAETVAAGSRADAHTAEIFTQQSERSNASISTNVTATSGISRADPNARGHDTDATTGSGSTDAVSVTGFSAVDALRSEPRVVVDDTAREQKSPDTRTSTSDNELAGGVTLASLGAAPMGFQAYQVMMPDAAFYAPRDIYRGQQTVDNARALRGLGSDQLHQDMIDQQYRR
jgi:hypothetical protein